MLWLFGNAQSFLGIKKRVTAIISILSEWRSLLETIIGDKFPILFASIILLVGHTIQNYLSHFLWMQCSFFGPKKKKGQQVERGNQYQDLQKAVYLEAGLSKQDQWLDWLRLVDTLGLWHTKPNNLEREVFIFFVHASLVCHLRASSSTLKWDGAWAVPCL